MTLQLSFLFSTEHEQSLWHLFLSNLMYSVNLSYLKVACRLMKILHIAEALQTNSSLTKLSLCSMELKHTKQNVSALSDMVHSSK